MRILQFMIIINKIIYRRNLQLHRINRNHYGPNYGSIDPKLGLFLLAIFCLLDV